MKNIISPINKDLLKEELTPERFLRNTNKGGNQIYSFSYHEAPNLMLEVARLREITYRNAGGGSGGIIDIDIFDTMKVPYRQLIVWTPEAQEIIGGYRYLVCNQKANNNQGKLSFAMTGCFRYSQRFKNKYLPFCIELGRAFIRPEYQATKAGSKSLFALDNLWDGLGALIVRYPTARYFIGKVTLFHRFNPQAQDILFHYLGIYFPDHENLIDSLSPLRPDLSRLPVGLFLGTNREEDFSILLKALRKHRETLPPMMSAYMKLSSTMKVMGINANKMYDDVAEIAILITIKDIFPLKLNRHIQSIACRDQCNVDADKLVSEYV